MRYGYDSIVRTLGVVFLLPRVCRSTTIIPTILSVQLSCGGDALRHRNILSVGTEYLYSEQLKEATLERQFVIVSTTCCYKRRGVK